MRSAIDQIYRATGKANDGQIVRQDLREQTFNALARFHKILRRAREHGELSALRRTAARQIDVEPGLSIELPHQAFFVSGFEVPVIRHGRRRGMIETSEQEFNRLVAIGSSMDQRVGAAGGRQTADPRRHHSCSSTTRWEFCPVVHVCGGIGRARSRRCAASKHR